MKAALHLATPDDLDRLMALAAAFHAEEGLELTEAQRESALRPLTEGIPHGAAYLIGPARAPIGYLVVTFGWSVEFGGLDGFIDEIYLRPAVRGRGIATEVILALGKTLAGAGMKALHLEVDATNDKAVRLYTRTGFQKREHYMLMTRWF